MKNIEVPVKVAYPEYCRIISGDKNLNRDRESMVSALTKKVKKGVMFVRTGPNIFGLKGQ